MEDWDSTKYTESFTLMKEMVKTMALDTTVTTTIIGDLTHWEANGMCIFKYYVLLHLLT